MTLLLLRKFSLLYVYRLYHCILLIVEIIYLYFKTEYEYENEYEYEHYNILTTGSVLLLLRPPEQYLVTPARMKINGRYGICGFNL